MVFLDACSYEGATELADFQRRLQALFPGHRHGDSVLHHLNLRLGVADRHTKMLARGTRTINRITVMSIIEM